MTRPAARGPRGAQAPRHPAALEYINKGIPILPVWGITPKRNCLCGMPGCPNPGKHPVGHLVPHGLKDATTDAATVTAWWTKVPSANIATPTSWCVVLDIDPPRGGSQTLAALESTHGPLPATPVILTGGGGFHVYFARPRSITLSNSVDRVGPGLDIRAEGGYVLLPPSSHVTGGVYRDSPQHPILFEVPLAPMPEWLIALATTKTETNGHGAADYAQLWQGVPHGQRHYAATRLAGHLIANQRRLDVEELVAQMANFAERCSPPFPIKELRAIVRDLVQHEEGIRRRPQPEPTEPAAPPTTELELQTIQSLFTEPAETVSWIVHELLPSSGLSELVAKPKVGKSTLARCLAVAVARGELFLGRPTTKGLVIYCAFEEKKAEVRRHFQQLGVTEDEPNILVLIGATPEAFFAKLSVSIVARRPCLVIVDPMVRLLRKAQDIGEYLAVSRELEPILNVARDTGCHLQLVHHGRKAEGEGGDSSLGSTSIFGTVDVGLFIRKFENRRYLMTEGRYGKGFDQDYVLPFDPATGWVTLAGTRAEYAAQVAQTAILEFLKAQADPVKEDAILEHVEGRRGAKVTALRQFVADGRVLRTGAGGKGDPYHYAIAQGT